MRLDSLSCIIAALAFLIISASAAKAQELAEAPFVAPTASPMPREAKPSAPRVNQSLPPQASMDRNEVTILRDNYAGKYNMATLENLSKMYWRLGAFDMQDDLAVGNYVKITDCKIYTNFVNDDLEWSKIVNTVRGQLDQARGTFPLNFQFLIELNLGRYDPARGGFPLTNKTGFKDAKRIEVDSMDARKEICYDPKAILDYPKSIFILLPQPFSLDFIKLDEHVAQAYILRKKSEYSQLPEEVRVRRYERDAFLRLRVTFNQYHGNLEGPNNMLMGILFGKIDGYEIFEDSGQKRLMLSVDIPDAQQTSLMSLPSNDNAVADAFINKQPPRVNMNSVAATMNAVAPAGGGITPVSHSFAQ
jgi:hypothetical protein